MPIYSVLTCTTRSLITSVLPQCAAVDRDHCSYGDLYCWKVLSRFLMWKIFNAISNLHNNSCITAACHQCWFLDYCSSLSWVKRVPAANPPHSALFLKSSPGFTRPAQHLRQLWQDALCGAVSTVQIHEHPLFPVQPPLRSSTPSTDLPIAIAGPCLLLICQNVNIWWCRSLLLPLWIYRQVN